MSKQQLNNGIHDISNQMYHSSEGLSRSALWEFKRSPRHYFNKYLNPNTPAEVTTPQMKLGELVHAMVLEPEKFDERYILEAAKLILPKVELLKDLVINLGKDLACEEFERQKKARFEIQEQNEFQMHLFLKLLEDKESISRDMYEEAKAMADSVLSDEIAQQLFKDVRVEHSIYFTHESTGLQCKVRPDAWTGGIVTDLKTAKDARYRAFQNAAFSSGYFLQAAMIKQGLASVGIELERFVFYCVEKTAGFPCVYYILDEDAINYGTKQFNTLMERMVTCIDQDIWSSYEPQTLFIPNYAKFEEITND